MNNIDIREHGSQNAGTTNALRTLGKKAGAVVLLGDFIKAFIAIIIMILALKSTGLDINIVKLVTGFGVVLGHNFPFWLNFKGGKGIAVTGAVIIAFSFPNNPVCFWVCLALFVGLILFTKYVSVGSLAVVTAFLAYNAIVFKEAENYMIIVAVTFLFTISGIYMHRANIQRLLNGTENKLNLKKKTGNVANAQNNMNNNMQNNMMQNGMNNMQNNMMQNNMNNMQSNMNNMQNGMLQNNMMQNNMMQNNMNNMQNNMMQNDMGNMQSDFNDNNKTSSLYNTNYINQVRRKKVNANVSDDSFKAYDACDTMDETRELNETELMDNYSSDYKNI
jgi:glycerol-3-phosphate acyltransferase PlsY